ncbi:MAG: class I SAM-dependent methyltransferase [Actinobacteria bacterium]|nr:class I SAM-dependent methyltransferase [Actinomycetota bacterium]
MAIAELIARALGGELPVAIGAYDGSRVGPAEAPATIAIRSPAAIARIIWAPGELGFGRAYVAGEIDIDGDIYTVVALGDRIADGRVSRRALWPLARAVGLPRLRPPPPPPEEARLGGRLHARRRDANAIAHHYDVGNAFYERVLGPAMTYSCAVWETSDTTLEEAQAAKHELICRKLALRPGMRLLDIGCGWGAMVRHAALHHGVHAVGVTISERQAAWARERIATEGLADRVEIRVQDYRDIPDGPFDAISSVGMFEHVGIDEMPLYLATCASLLGPGGRLLNHGITRPTAGAAISPTSFVGSFVFPDAALPEVGALVSATHEAGLEVRHVETLREHYARTLRAWVTNLEAQWDECVADSGEGRARVWRLYMAGSAVRFEEGAIQVHQVLAVRADAGKSGFSARPDWR